MEIVVTVVPSVPNAFEVTDIDKAIYQKLANVFSYIGELSETLPREEVSKKLAMIPALTYQFASAVGSSGDEVCAACNDLDLEIDPAYEAMEAYLEK